MSIFKATPALFIPIYIYIYIYIFEAKKENLKKEHLEYFYHERYTRQKA